MKFKLSTSGQYYGVKSAADLRKLGFDFKLEVHKHPIESAHDWTLRKLDSVVEVEIPTLEALIAFSDEWGKLIIKNGAIEIYDDDRE